MPSAVSPGPSQTSGIVKFTNCLLVRGNELVDEDLWVSSITGKILNGQEILYEHRTAPDQIIDLGGRILSPGFIDVQLNGAYGFDFSVIPEEGPVAYGKGVKKVNKNLIRGGVTSYLPTLTSQLPEVYHTALPFLGPSGHARDSSLGSESLGAHCEGPFISPTKNGCHKASVLQVPSPDSDLSALQACYGPSSNLSGNSPTPSSIKLITLAPELPNAIPTISALAAKGIVVSIGHTEATYEEALAATKAGATSITHLFNAMKPLHHRNPGIFGLLGTEPFPPSPPSSPTSTSSSSSSPSTFAPQKPYFGIIADGIHNHPTTLRLAYASHPSGLYLVSDAMNLSGQPDGIYPWTNGSRIIKRGAQLTLEENGRIAGSGVELVDCVSYFWRATGCSVAQALGAVTEVPAKMLGVDGKKGGLGEGKDADLVVLSLEGEGEGSRVVVDEVWKFGNRVFTRAEGGRM